jgi:hypothetical protein
MLQRGESQMAASCGHSKFGALTLEKQAAGKDARQLGMDPGHPSPQQHRQVEYERDQEVANQAEVGGQLKPLGGYFCVLKKEERGWAGL